MCPVFWPLTPVSSDKHVLTLGAANAPLSEAPTGDHVLLLPGFLFGGVVGAHYFFLGHGSVLLLREGVSIWKRSTEGLGKRRD